MARTRDEGRARRIELGVYAAAAVSYVVVGFFARSAVLNWIVGPAWFVAWVTLVTPLVLRVVGVQDPDGRGVSLPDPASFAADGSAEGADAGGATTERPGAPT